MKFKENEHKNTIFLDLFITNYFKFAKWRMYIHLHS